MTSANDRARALTLVDRLVGPSDPAADRAVAVLHAQAAALALVREATGVYPAPPDVSARLREAAESLRSGVDDRDPRVVLERIAVNAVAVHRAGTVA
jgi:hypothetical protein